MQRTKRAPVRATKRKGARRPARGKRRAGGRAPDPRTLEKSAVEFFADAVVVKTVANILATLDRLASNDSLLRDLAAWKQELPTIGSRFARAALVEVLKRHNLPLEALAWVYRLASDGKSDHDAAAPVVRAYASPGLMLATQIIGPVPEDGARPSQPWPSQVVVRVPLEWGKRRIVAFIENQYDLTLGRFRRDNNNGRPVKYERGDVLRVAQEFDAWLVAHLEERNRAGERLPWFFGPEKWCQRWQTWLDTNRPTWSAKSLWKYHVRPALDAPGTEFVLATLDRKPSAPG